MFTALRGLLIADAVGWDHMNGWGWGGMVVGWSLMIGLVLLAIWAFAGRNDGSHGQTPLDVLETRFARGEITAEEYHERREVLVQSRSRKRR